MTLSTSSSKTELLVVGSVLLVLVAVELALRLIEPKLSFDIAHIQSAPREASLMGSSSTGVPKVLLLGNSLLREGLDRPALQQTLDTATGEPVPLAAYHPDGSGVQEWRYTFRKNFLWDGGRPDLLVVFTGRTHLRDGRFRPKTLGAFHTSLGDSVVALSDNHASLDEAGMFFASRWSALYRNRERLRPRVFTLAVPHYQASLRALNSGRNRRLAHVPVEVETDDLTALLGDARAAGIQVVVAPVPAPDPYTLDPEVAAVLTAEGVPVLATQPVPGLSAENFPDGWHLDRAGAKLYTERLGSELQRILNGIGEGRNP